MQVGLRDRRFGQKGLMNDKSLLRPKKNTVTQMAYLTCVLRQPWFHNGSHATKMITVHT